MFNSPHPEFSGYPFFKKLPPFFWPLFFSPVAIFTISVSFSFLQKPSLVFNLQQSVALPPPPERFCFPLSKLYPNPWVLIASFPFFFQLIHLLPYIAFIVIYLPFIAFPLFLFLSTFFSSPPTLFPEWS